MGDHLQWKQGGLGGGEVGDVCSRTSTIVTQKQSEQSYIQTNSKGGAGAEHSASRGSAGL